MRLIEFQNIDGGTILINPEYVITLTADSHDSRTAIQLASGTPMGRAQAIVIGELTEVKTRLTERAGWAP